MQRDLTGVQETNWALKMSFKCLRFNLGLVGVRMEKKGGKGEMIMYKNGQEVIPDFIRDKVRAAKAKLYFKWHNFLNLFPWSFYWKGIYYNTTHCIVPGI